MRRLALMLLLVGCCFATLHGQSEIQHFQQASEAYDMGHFELADSLLKNIVNLLPDDYQVKAYRLLALSNLKLDRHEQAESYTEQLLMADPFYTAHDDNPRFMATVERLKMGKNLVSTASKLVEREDEVPVPMTLITEEMIRASGCIKLADLLMLYVPGMSIVGGINDNMAMRGIYAIGQETMLVMVDGHRMNSISTNGEAFDYRYNIDRIKQIEVLRGPASSLYGNVALTAVVNIITKSANEIDGGKVSALSGNFKTYGGSLIFGNGNMHSEYLAWASFFRSDGQVHNLNGSTHYSEGYNNRPTIDLGMKIRWGNLKVSAYGQFVHKVPFYSLLEYDEQYSYDKYLSNNGDKPGLSRTNLRTDIEYSHTWGSITFVASAFGSMERMQVYNALGDTIPASDVQILTEALRAPVTTQGSFQIFSWEDYSLGGMASGTINYKYGKNAQGSVMVGTQYENLIIADGQVVMGGNFSQLLAAQNNILYNGLEYTLSGFTQLKHNFSTKLIFNGGLRYDHKVRNDKRRINNWSPRASIIWIPTPVFSLKGGYSHSYVDAPAFYRSSKLRILAKAKDLDPEVMDAFQLGATFNWKPKHLKYDMNLFYNNVKNLVFYNIEFDNSGRISMGGIENTLQYNNQKTLLNLTLTYQHPFEVEKFYSTGSHKICNIPEWLFNVVASQKIIDKKHFGSMWIRANMHVQSKQESIKNNLKAMLKSTPNEIYSQSAYAIFGTGCEWESPKGLGVSLDISNLFDTYYEEGSLQESGIPGLGFRLMGRVSYKF